MPPWVLSARTQKAQPRPPHSLRAVLCLATPLVAAAGHPAEPRSFYGCQGLTLHNRVRLDLESCHLTLRHLCVAVHKLRAAEGGRPATRARALAGGLDQLTTNSLSVAYDGNRLILNDLELRQQFSDAADSPSAWTTCWARASSPAGSRRTTRCAASGVLGNLGDDILSKITLKSGVGTRPASRVVFVVIS